MTALSAAWAEYLDLLAQRAPRTRATVRSSAQRTQELESSLEVAVPAELREWFDLHDGTGYDREGELLPINFLVGLDEAIKSTRLTREIWSEAEERQEFANTSPDRDVAGTVTGTWLPEYVYISNDGLGGGLFIDTRPGALQGCVRNWDKTEADDDYGQGPVADNLADLVVMAAAAVRTGEPSGGLGFRASIADGVLKWEPAD